MTSQVMVLPVRNINEALWQLVCHHRDGLHNELWRTVAPRGMETKEWRGIWITEYLQPMERVLFYKERDAHPFFHFMESLWILAGRRDVKWIAQYLKRIAEFSDDGDTFHAAYGHRMRGHFASLTYSYDAPEQAVPTVSPVDQLLEVILLLKKDRDTRRAVVSFWDPASDLNRDSKDLPCNDLLMFKVREDVLDLTVCCRSNDALWGAYGTNAVQFSMIQEFVAGAIGIAVGTYRQISDSFHIYTGNASTETWLSLQSIDLVDPYSSRAVCPYPIIESGSDYLGWLKQLDWFMEGKWHPGMCDFFKRVAFPIKEAWEMYKGGTPQNVAKAIEVLRDCDASDWRTACVGWLSRRLPK